MKYKSDPKTVDGIRFDSKKEANRYLVLKGMVESGEIWDLRRQVKFLLTESGRLPSGKWMRESSYIADFVYQTKSGRVVEDVKGFRTKDYILKKKMMWKIHQIEVKEV